MSILGAAALVVLCLILLGIMAVGVVGLWCALVLSGKADERMDRIMRGGR